MCYYIYTCTADFCLTPCDTFVWQCVKALAAFDLLWVSLFGLAIILVLEVIEFLIKLKEDYEDERREKRSRHKRKHRRL